LARAEKGIGLALDVVEWNFLKKKLKKKKKKKKEKRIESIEMGLVITNAGLIVDGNVLIAMYDEFFVFCELGNMWVNYKRGWNERSEILS